MSQYPYGYGQYPGHPPPPPPPPNHYAYPGQPAYPPMPGYGPPHDPNAPLPNYYAMTQAAYDYNSSIPAIPGLGIGGTSVAGAPYQPPPPPPSWGHPQHPQPHAQQLPQGQQVSQDVNLRFAAATTNAPSPYGYSGPPQFKGPADHSFQSASHNNAQAPPPNSALPPRAPPHANDSTQDSDEMEEGELSDGQLEDQFEDLYDPVDSSTKGKDTTAVENVLSIPDESQPTSAADTPSGGFYTQEEDDSDNRNGSLKGVGASAAATGKNMNGHQDGNTDARERERSGSYSPYLSPREIEDASTPKDAGGSNYGYQDSNHRAGETGTHNGGPSGQSEVPGLGQAGNHALAPNPVNGLAATTTGTSQDQTTNGINNTNTATSSEQPYKALTEAKKEAQKAILKLWPQGVRYKHYIDEGIDERVVKLLFNELHLDISTGLPIQSEAAQQSHPESQASAASASKSPTAERKTVLQPEVAAKPSETGKMATAEERKDRIARLLADKAAKAAKAPAPAAAPTPASIPVSTEAPVLTQAVATAPATAPAPAVPALATTQGQAWAPVPGAAPVPVQTQPASSFFTQPLATVQGAPPATTSGPAVPSLATTAKSSGVSTPTGSKPKTKEEMQRLLRQKMEALQKSRVLSAQKAKSEKTNSSPVKSGGAESGTPAIAALAPVSTNVSTANASPQQQPSQDKGPIPGLFLSGGPTPQPVNIRKRPVAADFVDYSSTESRKRPFGQERQSSSLVIDVSDSDSGDEEMDIDMDMDSPDETPLPVLRNYTQERKGPSLAEFPPLRDLSRRNVSSPTPSATHTPPAAAMSTKDRELLAKEKAIQDMKRKIAEYEAKKKGKNGSETPKQTLATPSEANGSESSGANGPRASSVSLDKVDGPSAQLISESVTASLPKPSEPASKENARAESGKSVSQSVSRVDSAQEEKKKKAAALREAREARMREAKARIEAEKARLAEEEARMQEEEARLLAEEDQDDEMEDGSDDDNQSEHMSVDEEQDEEARKEDEPKQNVDNQAVVVPQTSLSEVQEKPSSPIPASSEAKETEIAATEALDVPMSEESSSALEEPAGTPVFVDGSGSSTAAQQQVEDSSTANKSPVVEQALDLSPDVAAAEPPMTSTGEPGYEAPSELYKPADPAAKDSDGHVAVSDSSEFSPEPVGDQPSGAPDNLDTQGGDLFVPATISDNPQSRAQTQEVEGPATSEPQSTAPAPRNPASSFVPYESSLRSFRAFKFHPEFKKLVPGGVKSLTYSNKIDPRKQLCPDELQGGACPRGQDCEFQHLNTIGVSDEQILVELGRADDYAGEQKDRFIQGLRELLQDIRANQVRDFDTIANSILEYRSRFLGDKSKILPLGNVTL